MGASAHSARRRGLEIGGLPLLAALLALYTAAPVAATPITSPGSLDPASTIIDFQTTPGDPEPFSDAFATITSSTENAVVRSGFDDNPGVKEGLWFGCPSIDACSYTIAFPTGVSEFGLGVVNAQLAGTILRILNGNGDVLEETAILTKPPDDSSYHGFIRSANEIMRAELIAPAFSFVGMDNVSYYAVPSPATVGLLSSGLLALGLLGRRRGN